MDAVARERGLEHVQKCASCAMLLVEERALSRDLRALSAGAAAEEIPARLETTLLTAFRQRAVVPTAAPAAAGTRRWLLVAAALALLTFGLSLAGLSLARWIAPSPERESSGASPANGGTALIPTGLSASSGKSGQEQPRAVAVRRPARPILKQQKSAPQVARLWRRFSEERRQKRLALASAKRRSASDDAPREFVTQFFPVMQGGELIPLEGGQIVRVKMPRSNLIPLGIPFNQERANETIQADVLVSNDGLARAIRLIY